MQQVEHLVLEIGSARRIGWLVVDLKDLHPHRDPTLRSLKYYITKRSHRQPIPVWIEARPKNGGKQKRWLWIRPQDEDAIAGELLLFRPYGQYRKGRVDHLMERAA